MTNTTGPAQQQGQPTQLTAAEAGELFQLIRAYGAAKFSAGLQCGLATPGEALAALDQAHEQADAALLALHNWQRNHGLTPEVQLGKVTP